MKDIIEVILNLPTIIYQIEMVMMDTQEVLRVFEDFANPQVDKDVDEYMEKAADKGSYSNDQVPSKLHENRFSELPLSTHMKLRAPDYDSEYCGQTL